MNYAVIPIYTFNLNYIALRICNILKIISITNGKLVKTFAFDKEIFQVIESDFMLYILFNDPNIPCFMRVIESQLEDAIELTEKENLFETSGEISHYRQFKNLYVFLKNKNSDTPEVVVIKRAKILNITSELEKLGITIKDCQPFMYFGDEDQFALKA